MCNNSLIQKLEQKSDAIYSLIKEEYDHCFDYLNLFKKDYFTIIGTIIAIFAVIGYLINNQDIVYWIPISFLMIVLFSIGVVLNFFYFFFVVQRKKFSNDDTTDILCLDLFFKNVRPVLYAISLLLLINTICLIVVISGMTNVPNIQDPFLHFLLPGEQYATLISHIPLTEKQGIDNAIKFVEVLFVLFFIIQTLMVFIFTFIIQKIRPPFITIRHFLKIFFRLFEGIKSHQFDGERIASSIYYISTKSTPFLFQIFYLVFLIAGGFFLILLFSYTMGIPG